MDPNVDVPVLDGGDLAHMRESVMDRMGQCADGWVPDGDGAEDGLPVPRLPT